MKHTNKSLIGSNLLRDLQDGQWRHIYKKARNNKDKKYDIFFAAMWYPLVSPLLGLGKLSWRRNTTFSTKCWMSPVSGPRTNTIQSWVKPSDVTFFLSWALWPNSSFTCTVHWKETNTNRVKYCLLLHWTCRRRKIYTSRQCTQARFFRSRSWLKWWKNKQTAGNFK